MSLFGRNADDTRVVSLVFDNSGFESNAKQSLSTLDKLKNALNESTKVKIFDDINEGVRSVTIQPIVDGVNEVTAKFSTLTSMTDQWKRRMADTVYDAVTGVISNSTIGQLTAGWAKYEEKTQSVQTIMAATAKDWANQEMQMNYVNEQLGKLNWYSDETSASLTDMTDNISKFINNGVEIEAATSALMGVSNWAYISGANIQQASRAMYNLSQSMGTGAVKLQDWMSIENAQMATMEFKQTVLETGEAMGLLEKASDDTWKSLDTGTEITLGSFRENLKDGWFTSELLVNSLKKYSGYTEALYRSLKRLGGEITATELMGWVDEFMAGTLDVKALADDLFISADQLEEELTKLSDSEYDLSRRATKAAQEAKTLTEALDSVKDAASTAWMSIYETLFGDYLEQRGFWTSVANQLYNAFVEPVNAIGTAIEGAFEKEAIIGQKEWNLLKSSGLVSDDSIDEIVAFAKKFGYLAKDMEIDADNFEKSLDNGWFTASLIRKMWDYHDGALAASEATKTGIKDIRDFRKLAEKLANDPVKGQESELFGWKTDFYEAGFNEDAYQHYVQTIIDEYEKLKESEGEAAYVTSDILDKADAELLHYLGLTDGSVEATQEYIDKLNEEGDTYDRLCEKVEKLGRYVTEVDDEGNKKTVLAKMDISYYWGKSLQDVLFSLGKLVEVVGGEFEKVFGGSGQHDIQQFALSVYDAVERFKDFVINSQTLRDVLDIVFSIGKIVFTSFQRKLSLISTIINSIIGGISGEENSVTKFIHSIAEAITKFADWFSQTNLFKEAFGLLGDILGDATAGIRGWFSALNEGKGEEDGILSKIWNGFTEAVSKLGDMFAGLRVKYKEFKKMLGTMKDKDVFSVLVAFKETFLDYIANFEGFDNLKKAFGDLKKTVKGVLKSVGIDVDGILGVFGAIGEGAGPWFDWLLTNGQELAKTIGSIFGAVGSSLFSTMSLSRLKTAFTDFFSSIGPWVDKLKSKWKEFKDTVNDAGGFKLSNIGKIFTAFYDTIIKHFGEFKGFDGFKKAFNGLWDTITYKLQKVGIDIPGFIDTIVEKFNSFKTSIQNSAIVRTITGIFDDIGSKISEYSEKVGGLEGLGDKVKEKWEQLKTIATTVKNVFLTVKDAVGEAVEFIMQKLDQFGIPDFIAGLFGLGGSEVKGKESDTIVAKISNASEAVQTFTREVSGMSEKEFTVPKWLKQLKDEVLGLAYAFMAFKTVTNVTDIVSGLSALNKAQASAIKKTNALKIAAAIGILAGVVYALSKLSWEQIARGVGATAVLGALIFGIAALFSRVDKLGNGLHVAGSILGIAAAIGMMLGVVWLLKDYEAKDLENGVWAIIGSAALLMLMLVAMIPIGAAAIPAGLSLLGVAGAIGMLAILAWLMGNANPAKLVKGAVVMAGAMTMLGLMFKAMNHFGIDASESAKGMRDVGVALIAISAALVILQFLNPKRFGNILLGLVGVLGSFFIICVALNKFSGVMKDTGDTFKNIAILVAALVGSVVVLGLMPTSILIKGEIALLGCIGILSIFLLFVGIASKLGADLSSMNKTVLNLAILIGAIGGILTLMAFVLGDSDPGKYVTMAESIAIVMGAIAVMVLAMTVPAKYGDNMKQAGKALLLAIAAAAGAALALWIASHSVGDPEKLVNVAQALALVMVAIAALMAAATIPAKFGDKMLQALKALGIAVLAAVGAAAALWIASQAIDDPQKLITIAEAIAIVMAAIGVIMAAVAIPANLVNTGGLLPALGALALAIGAMAGVAFALTQVANSVEDSGKIVQAAEAIAIGLGAIVVVAALMGVIGALSATVAAGAVVIGVIVLAIIGLGILIKQIPTDELDEQIAAFQKLGEVMAAIGDCIGEIIGGFIGGVGAGIIRSMDGVSDTLVHLGKMMEFVDADAIEDGMDAMDRITEALGKGVWTTFWNDTLGSIIGSDQEGMMAEYKANAGTLADTLVEFTDKMDEIGHLNIPTEDINNLSEAIKNLPFTKNDFMSIFLGDDAPSEEQVQQFKELALLLAGAVVEFDAALPDTLDTSRISAAASVLKGIAELTQAAIGAYQQGESIRTLLNGGDYSTGDTDFIDLLMEIGGMISSVSNLDYNVKNLDALSTSIDNVTELLGKFKDMQLPSGQIGNQSRVERIFGNISTMVTTLDSLKGADLTKGEELKGAVDKIKEITFDGDISDDTKVDSFITNAQSLIDVFLDVAEKAVAARQDISEETKSAATESSGGLAEVIQSLTSDGGALDIVGGLKDYLPEGGFGNILGDYFGLDENGALDLSSLLGENFDLKEQLLGENGFNLSNLFGDEESFSSQLTKWIGTDENGNIDLSAITGADGLGGLEDVLGGITGDAGALKEMLSAEGDDSLIGLFGNLGKVLGGTDGTNAQIEELQTLLGGLGDEANGLDGEGLLGSLDTLYDKLNIGEDGTGELKCKLVLDCEEYDQAIAQLRDGFTTDGYLASPQVNNLIQASIDLSPLETAIDGLKTDNQTNFSEVQRLVSGLSSDIITLANRMSEIQMILDTGVLVGELSARVDQELGYAYNM